MTNSIIFHIPKVIEADSAFGSKIRPYKLISAFKSMGFETEVIAGTSISRKKKIQEVLNNIRKGKRYDFMYSESSNAPIPVSDSHHIPFAPLSDYHLFKELKKNNITSGVYYRDIFWKFDVFSEKLSLPIRLLTLPLYKLDWMMYSKYMDYLFLPSQSMAKYLHTQWPENRISILPPGCDIVDCESYEKLNNDKLTCFYVGGILPPVYDLKEMFEVFSALDEIQLVLCCRQDEWQKMKAYYGNKCKNIKIVHENNQGIKKYYCNSDLFISAWGKDPYLEIAMPIKIFEALGYGVPVIITEGSEASRFVSDNNIGWTISNTTSLTDILIHLKNHKNEIDEKIEIVKQVRLHNTWVERAKQITRTLSQSK